MDGGRRRPCAAPVFGTDQCDGGGQSAQGRTTPQAGLDHPIGPSALAGIGHLLGADGGQPGRAHARTPQDTLGLKEGGARHHRHPVATALAAGLEQQRDIEHHQIGTAPGMALQKLPLGRPHQRMQDRFEAAERLPVAEHAPTQLAAIDRAVFQDSRKRRLDRCHRLAAGAEQRMHGRIGIVHGNAHPAQHRRRRAFAHADRAGETEYFHGSFIGPQMHGSSAGDHSFKTHSRNSSVTSGTCPNHASKPGTACHSSMPNPSTARLPRARASFNN